MTERVVVKTEHGVYLDGKYTSNEAIEDVKVWANTDPETAKAIFDLVSHELKEYKCPRGHAITNPACVVWKKAAPTSVASEPFCYEHDCVMEQVVGEVEAQ
jgi:hypothetical protein